MHLILGDLIVRDKNRTFGSSTEVSDHLWYLHMSSLLECPFYASCKTYIQVKSRNTANNISYNSSLIDCLIYDHLMWWQFCWRMMALLQNKLYNSWLLQLIRLVNLKQSVVIYYETKNHRHRNDSQCDLVAPLCLVSKPHFSTPGQLSATDQTIWYVHTYMYVTQSMEGSVWSWMFIFLGKSLNCIIKWCSRAN